MSEQALRAFLERMLTDGALRAHAAGALAITATEQGFDCTQADCERLFKGPDVSADGELSDDALGRVSGGIGAPAIGPTISVSFSQNSDGLGGKFVTGR